MKINFEKSVGMTFTNMKQPSVLGVVLVIHIPRQVHQYKYSDILFTPSLKWDKRIGYICSRSLHKLEYGKRT